jgi:putative membrane protein
VDRLDSNYTRPLPVNVKVTFKLNGKPISAGEIKGKSGTVEVDYHLSNVTSKPVSVCFVGFNGKLVKKTVVAPSPILAYLSLTIPKNVGKFSAPGAAVEADRGGVNPEWTTALFKPLGATQQTLWFTMETPKAKIPKATLLLETLNPSSITGQAPAQSAAAVANAQAAVSAAVSKVQSDVAALELKASGSNQSPTGGPQHSSNGKRPQAHAASVHTGSKAEGSEPRSANQTSSPSKPPRLSFGTESSPGGPAVTSPGSRQLRAGRSTA